MKLAAGFLKLSMEGETWRRNRKKLRDFFDGEARRRRKLASPVSSGSLETLLKPVALPDLALANLWARQNLRQLESAVEGAKFVAGPEMHAENERLLADVINGMLRDAVHTLNSVRNLVPPAPVDPGIGEVMSWLREVKAILGATILSAPVTR